MKSGPLAPNTPLKGGDFVVQALIGQGGFGAVYVARQARLERLVAIKVLHPGHSAHSDMVERFRREALAAARLSHPHVLPVFDFDYDEEHGLWFLAMRYVEGANSLDHMTPPLDFELAVRIVAGVASALDAAHASAIVHRDVKPPNVLMDGTWPLLTDFGIAHLANVETLTNQGVAIGTPTYMSPEQAMGKEIGPGSDQYSLAVMAYELLAGQPPFKGDTPSLLYRHVHEAPPPPNTINRDVSPSAAQVILTAMNKSPADRFASCTDFADALSEAARGRPITSESAAAVMRRPTPTPASTPETILLTATPAEIPSSPTPQRQPTTITTTIRANPVRVALTALGAVAIVAVLAIAVARFGPSAGTAPSGQSQQASPGGIPESGAFPGSGGPPRPGTILLSDNFDDPSRAVLPTSPLNSSYRVGYVDGEYEIAGHSGATFLPGDYRDASLSVDARFIGDTTGRFITIACRASTQAWYALTMYPDSGRLELERISGTREHTPLIPEKQVPAILTGNTRNHIELSCSGDAIDVSINGTPVGSVRDSTATAGLFMITTGASQEDKSLEAELRLDNLVVRQR